MNFFLGRVSFNRAQNWSFSPVNNRNVQGHDLFIDEVPNHMHCNAYLGGAYNCPQGQYFKCFLTGGENFRLDEMEVYGISR